jgi:hypothetical protein
MEVVDRFKAKKGTEWTALQIVTFIVVALMAFSVGYIFWEYGYKTGGRTLDFLTLSECTPEAKVMTIGDFRDEIAKYGKREREGGGLNERYYPQDAIKNFKTYLACKQENIFTPENITSIEPTIMNDAKAVYGYYVEDIAKKMAASTVKKERDDLYKECSSVIDDYYQTFKVDLTQAKCPSP